MTSEREKKRKKMGDTAPEVVRAEVEKGSQQ